MSGFDLDNHRRCFTKMFYTLYDCVLQQVDLSKYLGKMINEDLRWSPQVEYVTDNTKKSTWLTKKKHKECPQEL